MLLGQLGAGIFERPPSRPRRVVGTGDMAVVADPVCFIKQRLDDVVVKPAAPRKFAGDVADHAILIEGAVAAGPALWVFRIVPKLDDRFEWLVDWRQPARTGTTAPIGLAGGAGVALAGARRR